MPAYYLRISYGMSDVCSSDLPVPALPPPSYDPPPTPPSPPRTSSGPILVVDASQPQPYADRAAPAGESRSLSPLGATATRSQAGSVSNPSTTVPQGTLIPAVLQPAFNSPGSGCAGALVTPDISASDGARVLIPRAARTRLVSGPRVSVCVEH